MTNEFMKICEIEKYKSIYDMYTIKNSPFDTNSIQHNFADVNKVYKILEQDNFVYPPQLSVC